MSVIPEKTWNVIITGLWTDDLVTVWKWQIFWEDPTSKERQSRPVTESGPRVDSVWQGLVPSIAGDFAPK